MQMGSSRTGREAEGSAFLWFLRIPGSGGRLGDGEKPPLARHALQLGRAAVGELDPGADDEVLDGARDEHLTGLRAGADSRADVDRHAANVVAAALALAGVE